MLLDLYSNFMHMDSLNITKKLLCHFDNKLTVELVDNCKSISLLEALYNCNFPWLTHRHKVCCFYRFMTAIPDTDGAVMDECEELRAPEQGQQYQNTVRRYPLETRNTRQEVVQSTPRFCESRNWGCTTYLTLSVGFIHILASTYIVTHSGDNVAIFFPSSPSPSYILFINS